MDEYVPVVVPVERAYMTAVVGAFVHAFPEFLSVLADHVATREFLVEPDLLLGEIGSSAALGKAGTGRVGEMAAWWRERMARYEPICTSVSLKRFLVVLEAGAVR